jgi:D-inositol-3-phosphate glycosyltransferase
MIGPVVRLSPSRPNILLVGGVRSASGYGRVIRHIGRALAAVGEVACVQVGSDDGIDAPGPLLANPHPYDFGARRFVPELVCAGAFAVVLVMHDLEYSASLLGAVPPEERRCAVVSYGPVEGAIAHPAALRPLRHADAVVLYTRRDAEQVREIIGHVAPDADGRARGPRVAWIPHGVDRIAFRPLLTLPDGRVDPRSREVARRELLGPELGAEISFLVLNANRNVPRKRIDATLRVFAAFSADKPRGVRLLLKASPGPGAGGCDIGNTSRALGIQDRVLVTSALGIPDALDDAALNRLYNACDVGINTSEGEGWGLIALEHAASGAPQILAAHPTGAELWSGYPGLVGVSSRRVDRRDAFHYAEVDEDQVKDALERLYRDDRFREEASSLARRVAERAELDWSRIGEAWRALVFDVVAERSMRGTRSTPTG